MRRAISPSEISKSSLRDLVSIVILSPSRIAAMGPPNAAENRLGLRWVQPGTTDKFTVDVRGK